MALDPSIALDVRPPQFQIQIPQPLQQFGQVLTLQGLMQQNQMRNLQFQQEMLQIQRQQKMADYLASLYQAPSAAAAPPVTPPLTTLTPAPATPVQPAAPAPNFFSVPTGAGIAGVPSQPQIDPAFGLLRPAPAVAPAPAPAPAAVTAPPLTTPAAAPAATAAPLTIPLAGGIYGGFPNIDYGKMYALGGPAAEPVVKGLIEQEKAMQENQAKRLEITGKTAARVGEVAQSVLDAKNPEQAYVQGVMQLNAEKVIDDPTARQWLAHGFDRDTLQQFARAASDVKTQHEITGTDLENFRKDKANVAQDVQPVYDQPGWDRVYSTWSPAMQQRYGKVYSPEIRATAIRSGIATADYPTFEAHTLQQNATRLADAMKQGQDIYQAELAKLPLDEQAPFFSAKTPLEVNQRALTPEQYITTSETAKQHAVTNLIEATKTKIDQDKFDAEFGPGSAQSWAAQVYAHPDTIKDVPANMRTAVLNAFTGKYRDSSGQPLPLPSQLDNTSLQQETAAKSTLGDVQWVRNALQNPNIANNIGPLLGNLQNVEQATGVATGLTGADAQMAQEFRTRMRNLLANEAAAMHARINPKTMDDLAKSSGRVNMDVKMLQGALDGVEGYANNKLEGYERQRFGGRMRPPEARSFGQTIPQTTRDALIKAGPGRHQGSDGTWYQVNRDGTVQSIPTPADAK